MSVKTKLSLIISLIVFVLLVLNVILNEYSARVNMRSNLRTNLLNISQQVSSSVNQNLHEYELVESVFEEKLQLASTAAAHSLGTSAEDITAARLAQLTKQNEITQLCILVQAGDSYTIKQSSDPQKVGLDLSAEGEADSVLQQGLQQQSDWARLPDGGRFWSGPLSLTGSESAKLGKWSFFTDEAHPFVIGSFIELDPSKSFGQIDSPTAVVDQPMINNLDILEVSGFNPELFGKQPAADIPKLVSIAQMNANPVSFGSYTYRDTRNDARYVAMAADGREVFRRMTLNGREVIKSFVRIQTPLPYVIGLVVDRAPLVKQIDEQRNNQMFISAVLLLIVVVCSYWLSGIVIRPIRLILWKVNEVSAGRFDSSIEVKRKDELGQLAKRVNAMSKNLSVYMNKLKKAFEENRSMKEHLESFINHTTDAIHVVDLSGKITQVNQAFEQMFGYTSEEAIGHILSLVPDELREEEKRSMEQLKAGKPLAARETVRVTKAGEWISVSVTTSPIRDEHGAIRAIASITRDMTSRNKMEELLRRSEKLTTVGQLAAGVAHEIRNPLTTLRGFLQLQTETGKLNTRHIDIMLSELDRINLIVGEFLILAKPQATRFVEKDVRFILGDVISLLDSQAHLCDIVFETQFCIESCRIACEENQLKQVFINVLKNAIEAMPHGGRIQIRIVHSRDRTVSVTIADEGVGIPEEMIPKLGDPFFTGKESGTGLGIMVSQRIIQSHQGTMEIKSSVNVGTTITIRLPLAQEGEE